MEERASGKCGKTIARQTTKQKNEMQIKQSKIKDIKIPILGQRPSFVFNAKNANTGDIKDIKASRPNKNGHSTATIISRGKNSSSRLTNIKKTIQKTTKTNIDTFVNRIRYFFWPVQTAASNIIIDMTKKGAMMAASWTNVPINNGKKCRINRYNPSITGFLILHLWIPNYPDILRTFNIISQAKKIDFKKAYYSLGRKSIIRVRVLNESIISRILVWDY